MQNWKGLSGPLTGLLLLALAPRDAAAQVNPALTAGEIVITEAFDVLMRVSPTTGATTPMNVGGFDPLDILAVDAARNIVAIDQMDRLVRFNPTTLAVTPLTSTLFPFAVDIAIESSGAVLVADNDNIYRVTTSGGTSTLVNHSNVNDGFFSPRGIAIGPTGRIFVTEFFEQLWEINPTSGAASKILLSQDATLASMVDVRSDGDLITSDFDEPRLLRINPNTGVVTPFANNIPELTFDLDLEADNDVIITSSEGLYRYNAGNGAETPLTVDEELFAPFGIAIAPAGAAVPFAAADFNRDGKVNSADLAIWRTNFGRTTGSTYMHGNADTDADVDGADFLNWQRQLSGAAAQAIPEPTAATLMFGLLAVCAKRRPFTRPG